MKYEFVPITRREYKAQDLMGNTTRIENVSNTMNWLQHQKILMRHGKVVSWYHTHGVEAATFRQGVKKLTELFGTKPTAHEMYSYMNAIWAFKWRDKPVLFCKSVRGVSIQVSSFEVKDLREFYADLMEKLQVK